MESSLHIETPQNWTLWKRILVPLLTIVNIIIVPLVVLLCLPFIIVRALIVLLSKCLPGYGKPVDSIGTTLGAHGEHAVWATGDFYEGNVDISIVRRQSKELILDATDSEGRLLFPHLSQQVVSFLGYWFWADDPNFRIDEHIYIIGDGRIINGSKEATQEIQNVMDNYKSCAKITNRGPLWSIVVLPNIILEDKPGPHSVIALTGHHIICDAMGKELILGRAMTPMSGVIRTNELGQGGSNIIKKTLINIIRAPYDIAWLTIMVRRTKGFHESRSNFSEQPTAISLTTEVGLQSVKAIAVANSVHITSVVIGAVASAIRKCRVQSGRRVHDISVTCLMPIPAGVSDAIRNEMLYIPILLPLTEPSPELRLQQINRNLVWSRKSSIAWVIYILARTVGRLPHILVKGMFNIIKLSQNLQISNFPGPRVDQCVFGYRRVESGPMLVRVGGSKAVYFFYSSFNGEGTVHLWADSNILSECQGKSVMHKVCDGLQEADHHGVIHEACQTLMV